MTSQHPAAAGSVKASQAYTVRVLLFNSKLLGRHIQSKVAVGHKQLNLRFLLAARHMHAMGPAVADT